MLDDQRTYGVSPTQAIEAQNCKVSFLQMKLHMYVEKPQLYSEVAI